MYVCVCTSMRTINLVWSSNSSTHISFNHKDHIFRYIYSYYNDNTFIKLSYLYNGKSYFSKMASVHWNGPQLWWPVFQCGCIHTHNNRYDNGLRHDHLPIMMTLSHWSPFRITVPLWGESTGHRWIPLKKATDVDFWCSLWCLPRYTVGQTVKLPVTRDIRTVMWHHHNDWKKESSASWYYM